MHILIADDHDIVREALALILSELAPNVTILECRSFSEALKLASECTDLNLAVFDLNMPEMPGTDGITEFCSRFPEIPVMVLSGYYGHQDIIDCFDKGAAGFIPKTLGAEGIRHAFRLVLAGEKFVPAEILEPCSGHVCPDQCQECTQAIGAPRRGLADSQLGGLTNREGEVLEKLAQGLSNKAIALELGIEEVTVKLHLRSVYKKFGAKNRAHAVQVAHNLGWEFGA